MINLKLTNNLTNLIAKKIINKMLRKRFGDDANVIVNNLVIDNVDGRFRVKLDAELDLSNDSVAKLINDI